MAKRKFETSIGLTDEFPFGYLKGSTVKEAILHHPEFVKEYHCDEYVLKGDAIKFMMDTLANKKRKRK